MAQPLNPRRGVNLIEVLIAFALVAVAFIGLASMFVAGMRLQQRSQEVSVASEVGREFLEECREIDFATIPTSPQQFDGNLPTPLLNGFPPAPYPTTTVGAQTCRLVVEVTPLAARLRVVKVEVQYGDTGHIRMETMIHP